MQKHLQEREGGVVVVVVVVVVEDEAQNLLCAQFYLWRNFSGHLCSDDLFLVTVFWSVSVPHFFTVN